MKILDLTKKLDIQYDKNLSYSFDNPGLNVYIDNNEIKNILICLDILDDTIEFAIKNDCNLIISHHPVIFSPIKNIVDDVVSNKIKKLISYNINAYSIHTNFDVEHSTGMGKIVLEQFDLKYNIEKEDFIEKSEDNINGLGKFIKLKTNMSINNIVDILINNFNISKDYIKTYSKKNNEEAFIKTLAILPGSGKSEIKKIIDLRPDLFISADLGHHDILDLIENNISYIDATHSGLEKSFCYYMSDFVKQLLTDKNINVFEYTNVLFN